MSENSTNPDTSTPSLASPSLDELLQTASFMANILYNAKQDSACPQWLRQKAEEFQAKWDSIYQGYRRASALSTPAPRPDERLITDSTIKHLPTACGNRYCAQHRDIWRHYEDHIATTPPSEAPRPSVAAPSQVSSERLKLAIERVRQEIATYENAMPTKTLDCPSLEFLEDLKILTDYDSAQLPSPEPLTCPKCGTKLQESWLNCPKCEGPARSERLEQLGRMSRELYEQAVKQAGEKGHWALHNALVEDGYDEKVDYLKLLDGPISEQP